MTRIATFLALAACLLVPGAAPAALPPAAPVVPAGPLISGDLGKRMDARLIESGFTGGVLVAVGGEVVLLKGYGMADREKKIPYGPDTVYPIGSITKQFTAAAILRLEMKGKLKVEDPIAKYLPDVPEDKRAITVHQLLTHTAGLDSDFAGDYDPVTRDDYVKKVLASKLRSKPGTDYFYANSGYSLLGAIVERVSGIGYETFLRKEFFEPAGMNQTGYKIPQWPESRVAVGYGPEGRWGTILEKKWLPDGPGWALRANGGIHSTLSDMYRWSLALDGDQALSETEKKKMFAPQVPEGPEGQSHYGYGWSIQTTPWKAKLVSHDGGNRIYSADFRRYVDDGIVILTASNDSSVKAFQLSPQLVRIAKGMAPAQPSAAAAALKPLGDSPRHQAARGFIDAFNSGDLARMREFRAKNMKSSAKMTDEQRDQIFRQMTADLGKLDILGVAAESDEAVTVVTHSGKVEPPVRLKFMFDPGPETRIAGIGVEIGAGE